MTPIFILVAFQHFNKSMPSGGFLILRNYLHWVSIGEQIVPCQITFAALLSNGHRSRKKTQLTLITYFIAFEAASGCP
jgi:hypothetical protein